MMKQIGSSDEILASNPQHQRKRKGIKFWFVVWFLFSGHFFSLTRLDFMWNKYLWFLPTTASMTNINPSWRENCQKLRELNLSEKKNTLNHKVLSLVSFIFLYFLWWTCFALLVRLSFLKLCLKKQNEFCHEFSFVLKGRCSLCLGSQSLTTPLNSLQSCFLM